MWWCSSVFPVLPNVQPAAGQFNLSKLSCAQEMEPTPNAFSLAYLLFALLLLSNPPPVNYCCSREANGGFVVIDLLPTVWFYDRCVGDAFS